MKRRRTIIVASVVAAIVLLAVLALFYGPGPHVGQNVHQAIALFREAGPTVFFLAMALLPAVGFPLGAFTLAAGPVFGPTLGVAAVVGCAILAIAVNVALSYWISSRALRPLISRIARWMGYTLPEISPANAWRVTLIVRIVPGPPFVVQSYLLGLARAPFRIYMAVSVVVPACYIAGTIMLGDALVRRDPWAIASAIALFVIAGGVIYQLQKRLSPPRPLDSPSAPDHG